MKLLLTSAGLSNDSIARALAELAGKPLAEISLAFIPTAMHAESGDKDWFLEDLGNIRRQHFRCVDVVDIAVLPAESWRARLQACDVLYLEGGNDRFLLDWLERSGLSALLPEFLRDKVYVGSSAGSMVTGPDLAAELDRIIYGTEADRSEDLPALGLVDFYFLPHLNTPSFPYRTAGELKEALGAFPGKVYALDDASALKVEDGKVEAVSEGEWIVLSDVAA